MPGSADGTDPILNRWVKHIEASCSEEKDFVVLLASGGVEEGVARIRDRMEISRAVGNIMTMGSWRGHEITLFCNGKLILKGFLGGRPEVESFLVDLLS